MRPRRVGFECTHQMWRRWTTRNSVWVLSVVTLGLTATMLGSCGTDNLFYSDDDPVYSNDPCSPDYVPWASSVIGPAGGVVEYAFLNTQMTGLQIRVPAGAWTACWEVEISKSFFWDTPDYPDGFEPFERPLPTGSVEISIFRQTEDLVRTYAPDSMYMEISFPLHSIPSNNGEIFSAFYYDSTAQSWRLHLPDELDNAALTVRTSAWKQLWSWGRIDLEEIDYDEHLAPAMEDQIGSDAWNEIQNTLDSIYDAALQDRMALTCIALDFAEAAFESLRDQAAANVNQLQSGIDCGTCDIISNEFYEGLVDYVRLNLEAMIMDMVADVIPGKLWFLKLGAKAYAIMLQKMARSLPCDYECFVREAPLQLYMNAAAYYATVLVIEAIQRFKDSGYINCAPGAPGDPLFHGTSGTQALGMTGTTRSCPVDRVTVLPVFNYPPGPQ